MYICLTSRILGCQMCSVWKSSVLLNTGTSDHGKRWGEIQHVTLVIYLGHWLIPFGAKFILCCICRLWCWQHLELCVNNDLITHNFYHNFIFINKIDRQKRTEELPVLLHFHLSSDRMALAGARKAKALAWNRGNLKMRKAKFRSDVATSLNNHKNVQEGEFRNLIAS